MLIVMLITDGDVNVSVFTDRDAGGDATVSVNIDVDH